MGYSATKISGEPIIIRNSKAVELVELLRTAQTTFGHISWCGTVESYEQGSDAVSVCTAILADYGFIVSNDNHLIVLLTWGGDKIGSSWDDIWNALAQVVDAPTEWVMLGEDDALWGEELKDGGRHTAGVQISLIK
jgi:hypothetical protein